MWPTWREGTHRINWCTPNRRDAQISVHFAWCYGYVQIGYSNRYPNDFHSNLYDQTQIFEKFYFFEKNVFKIEILEMFGIRMHSTIIIYLIRFK